jgi:hypothetical protein
MFTMATSFFASDLSENVRVTETNVTKSNAARWSKGVIVESPVLGIRSVTLGLGTGDSSSHFEVTGEWKFNHYL